MWVGVFVGGILGQLIPSLWGVDALSITSSFFSLVGGLVGLWIGFRIDQSLS